MKLSGEIIIDERRPHLRQAELIAFRRAVFVFYAEIRRKQHRQNGAFEVALFFDRVSAVFSEYAPLGHESLEHRLILPVDGRTDLFELRYALRIVRLFSLSHRKGIGQILVFDSVDDLTVADISGYLIRHAGAGECAELGTPAAADDKYFLLAERFAEP